MIVCLIALRADPAQAMPTPAQSAAAAVRYWNGPCQSIDLTFDPTLAQHGEAGVATGVRLFDDGRVELSACTISIATGLTPAVECRAIFHEVGHLAGHRHDEGGIMAAVLPVTPFPFCDPTPREQVFNAIEAQLPPLKWTIHCNPQLTRCRATSLTAKLPRRFAVIDGDVYPLTDLF
jgi:hypothetical protein